MKALYAIATLVTLAAAVPAHAQLYSAYAEGATNPNAWLTDVSDGSFEEFNDPSTNAVADDEVRRRIYYVVEGGTIFDERLQYIPVSPNGEFLPAVNIGFMLDQAGRRLRRTRALAFGNGVLYASNTGPGANGAPRGLYEVDPDTGDAVLLFDPQLGGQPLVFSGLDFNDADGLLYAVASGSTIYSIDPDSQAIAVVVDPPDISSSFDGVGGPRRRQG